MRFAIPILSGALILGGCSTTVQITGGDDNVPRFAAVRSTGFEGPNAVVILQEVSAGVWAPLASASANGIAPSLVSAGGSIGSATLLGSSFPENRSDFYTEETNVENGSGSSSAADGGAGGDGGDGGEGGKGGFSASHASGGTAVSGSSSSSNQSQGQGQIQGQSQRSENTNVNANVNQNKNKNKNKNRNSNNGGGGWW